MKQLLLRVAIAALFASSIGYAQCLKCVNKTDCGNNGQVGACMCTQGSTGNCFPCGVCYDSTCHIKCNPGPGAPTSELAASEGVSRLHIKVVSSTSLQSQINEHSKTFGMFVKDLQYVLAKCKHVMEANGLDAFVGPADTPEGVAVRITDVKDTVVFTIPHPLSFDDQNGPNKLVFAQDGWTLYRDQAEVASGSF